MLGLLNAPMVGHSPQQAHNQSDSPDVAGLHQVEDVVVSSQLLLLLLLLLLINLQGSRKIYSQRRTTTPSALMVHHTYSLTDVLEDLRSLNPVHLGSISQDSLSLCSSPLG